MKHKRKVILDLAVSIDGFIEGKNFETDWCIMDEEMEFEKFLDRIDTILYGRKSYDLWGTYKTCDDDFWNRIHNKKKIVFSKTIHETDENVTFVHDHIASFIQNLKKHEGKDIWLYGGASLIKTFIELNLIDEFRLSVHPVVLNEGTPLFQGLKERLCLTLMKTNTYKCGVVQLIYKRKDI